MHSTIKLSAISFAIAALITACGGGGGSAQGSAGPSVTVTGAAVKGPIADSKICFYELLTSGKGNLLACTNTTSSGNYSVNLNYSGAVFMEATGGTYTDETTGLTTTLSSPLTSVGIIDGSNSVVVATPLTTIAVTQALAGGNLTLPNFNTAATNVSNSFGVTGSITTTIPNITIGANSSYGSALIAVSKMLNSGMNLTTITQSSNLTQLQLRSNVAAQCIVAAEPGNVTSTPQMAGIFYTTVGGATASAVNSGRLKLADAGTPASTISYTNVTAINNGTLSFTGGGTQFLNCSPYSDIYLSGADLNVTGTICQANYSGNLTLNFTGNFTNVGNASASGNGSGFGVNLSGANTTLGGGFGVGNNSIGANSTLFGPIPTGNLTILGSSNSGSGVSFGNSNSTSYINPLLTGSVQYANVSLVQNTSARTSFTVSEPDSAWRTLLASPGSNSMGCTVTKNTPRQVVLDCPSSAILAGNLSLYTGTWLPNVPAITGLPNSGLAIHSRRIDISGSLIPGYNIAFNNSCPANLQALNMTLPSI